MNSNNSLLEAFKKTAYPVVGHGKRNIQVLQDVLKEMDGQEESDIYGTGKIIEEFQDKMAKFLGKEAAVFFPSGTMAQQIALRIWSDRKGIRKVAYHPLCHLEIREEDGLKELHPIESILLADKDRVIELDDIKEIKEDISCILLELPQREIGGQLPDYETLEEISAYCREKEIKLHLDGARLFEILPYYQKSTSEIAALFDSVYISFYKGIGGIAGAVLAGEESFIKESKVWKRRYGGDLISLYPYIVSANYFFEKRFPKMGLYYNEAKELAGLYNQTHQVSTRPAVPVSNMFHVHFGMSKEVLEPLLIEIYEETGIGLTSHLVEKGEKESFFEVSIGDRYETIPKDLLKKAFNLLNQKLIKQYS